MADGAFAAWLSERIEAERAELVARSNRLDALTSLLATTKAHEADHGTPVNEPAALLEGIGVVEEVHRRALFERVSTTQPPRELPEMPVLSTDNGKVTAA